MGLRVVPYIERSEVESEDPGQANEREDPLVSGEGCVGFFEGFVEKCQVGQILTRELIFRLGEFFVQETNKDLPGLEMVTGRDG